MGKKSRKKNQAKAQKEQSQQAAAPETRKNSTSSGEGGGFNPIKRWKSLSQVTRFVLTFALLIGAFYLFLWTTNWFHEYFVAFITQLDAKIASIILNIFGWGTVTKGYQISSDAMTLNVKTGCDGLEAMAIFGSGVIAYTAPLVNKFKGLLFGIGSLFVLNIIRVVHLYISGVYMPNYFEFFHEEFWQAVVIICALILLAVWINSLQKAKAQQ